MCSHYLHLSLHTVYSLYFSDLSIVFLVAYFFFFFFNDAATTEIYTLSLHDALPISRLYQTTTEERRSLLCPVLWVSPRGETRSEEHTSELQSRFDLVCRLLLEKKKSKQSTTITR